jgi:hypothetical protein
VSLSAASKLQAEQQTKAFSFALQPIDSDIKAVHLAAATEDEFDVWLSTLSGLLEQHRKGAFEVPQEAELSELMAPPAIISMQVRDALKQNMHTLG